MPAPTLQVHRVDPATLADRGDPSALPGHTSQGDVLVQFLHDSRPWYAERVALPARLRRILWGLVPAQLVWGILLALIVSGVSLCEGPICKVATMGGRPAVLLVGAALSLIGLVAVAISTRGLAEVDGREVAGLFISALAGGAALLGIAVLVTGLVIIALVVAAFVAAFTFTP